MARNILRSMGLLTEAEQIAPDAAPREAIEQFHTPRYLDVMLAAEKGHLDLEGLNMGLGTPETPVFVGMYDYAALACGATLAGADLVADGRADVAFNPSGGYHHAYPAKASGFCYMNDVVLACLRLAGTGRRVLFVDIDVHHCDGVQDAFYDRADVMTMSFHESGETLFPGTGFEDDMGAGEGRGYSVNVPLPPGTYDGAYVGAFEAVAMPLARAFDPHVIVLEIGMDGLWGDPLAHLSLTNNAYADVIGQVAGLGRPIVATGGGGYHAGNTARGWALAWTVLAGQDAPESLAPGLGGVMLESTEWQGGLRDRVLATGDGQRAAVDAALAATVEKLKQNVFSLHGL